MFIFQCGNCWHQQHRPNRKLRFKRCVVASSYFYVKCEECGSEVHIDADKIAPYYKEEARKWANSLWGKLGRWFDGD